MNPYSEISHIRHPFIPDIKKHLGYYAYPGFEPDRKTFLFKSAFLKFREEDPSSLVYPLNCIGFIQNKNPQYADVNVVAILVGPGHIYTSAMSFYNEESNDFGPIQDLEFHIAGQKSAVENLFINKHLQQKAKILTDAERQKYDYALAIIKEPLGLQLGYVGIMSPNTLAISNYTKGTESQKNFEPTILKHYEKNNKNLLKVLIDRPRGRILETSEARIFDFNHQTVKVRDVTDKCLNKYQLNSQILLFAFEENVGFSLISFNSHFDCIFYQCELFSEFKLHHIFNWCQGLNALPLSFTEPNDVMNSIQFLDQLQIQQRDKSLITQSRQALQPSINMEQKIISYARQKLITKLTEDTVAIQFDTEMLLVDSNKAIIKKMWMNKTLFDEIQMITGIGQFIVAIKSNFVFLINWETQVVETAYPVEEDLEYIVEIDDFYLGVGDSQGNITILCISHSHERGYYLDVIRKIENQMKFFDGHLPNRICFMKSYRENLLASMTCDGVIQIWDWKLKQLVQWYDHSVNTKITTSNKNQDHGIVNNVSFMEFIQIDNQVYFITCHSQEPMIKIACINQNAEPRIIKQKHPITAAAMINRHELVFSQKSCFKIINLTNDVSVSIKRKSSSPIIGIFENGINKFLIVDSDNEISFYRGLVENSSAASHILTTYSRMQDLNLMQREMNIGYIQGHTSNSPSKKSAANGGPGSPCRQHTPNLRNSLYSNQNVQCVLERERGAIRVLSNNLIHKQNPNFDNFLVDRYNGEIYFLKVQNAKLKEVNSELEAKLKYLAEENDNIDNMKELIKQLTSENNAFKWEMEALRAENTKHLNDIEYLQNQNKNEFDQAVGQLEDLHNVTIKKQAFQGQIDNLLTEICVLKENLLQKDSSSDSEKLNVSNRTCDDCQKQTLEAISARNSAVEKLNELQVEIRRVTQKNSIISTEIMGLKMENEQLIIIKQQLETEVNQLKTNLFSSVDVSNNNYFNLVQEIENLKQVSMQKDAIIHDHQYQIGQLIHEQNILLLQLQGQSIEDISLTRDKYQRLTMERSSLSTKNTVPREILEIIQGGVLQKITMKEQCLQTTQKALDPDSHEKNSLFNTYDTPQQQKTNFIELNLKSIKTPRNEEF